MRTKIGVFAQRALAGALTATICTSTAAFAQQPYVQHHTLSRLKTQARALYTLDLQNGKKATVYSNGLAQITTKGHTQQIRRIPPSLFDRSASPSAAERAGIAYALNRPPDPPYAPGRVIFALKSGVSASSDVVTVSAAKLAQSATAPSYTNDVTLNAAMAKLGVDSVQRVARSISKSRLEMMHAATISRVGASSIDISNTYVAHVTSSSVPNAVLALRRLNEVAYASPDYRVSTLYVPGPQIPAAAQQQAVQAAFAARMRPHALSASTGLALPSNFAISNSAQSLLDATGVDAVAAYDEIQQRYGQIPGQGEIITNVSIGDLDDASAIASFSDPCRLSVQTYGPTTRVIGGQRYIDWPSMPLIPTYVADSSGGISGSEEVCNSGDPLDGEIGLDFSMMAPLPHQEQRGDNMGSGYYDLLGIAPGAQYRLVVPGDTSVFTSDIIGTFEAAANQSPAPNVITASLGYGEDGAGFPDRYLEEDPLVRSAIADIVAKNIVVCISANDGLRTNTNAAFGPSGGAAATNLSDATHPDTDLNDIAYSTAPSYVDDSGAIDVGGTTLDDILAYNPVDLKNNTKGTNVRTVPETRFTGFTDFASGFGSRVNVSAPSDNVLAVDHAKGGNYNQAGLSPNGGTSASAPEVAAAAAILLQVGRLTGHPFQKATDVRALLESTGTPVTQAPQADQTLNVGPQIDVRRAVEQLMTNAGVHITSRLSRVAIMQRKTGVFDLEDGTMGTTFVEDGDPSFIDLQGPLVGTTPSNINASSYITIAPDWEGIPSNATYQLLITNNQGTVKNVLARTPSARFLPAQLLSAANLSLDSSTGQTINLVYRAVSGMHVLAQQSFQMHFGPLSGMSEVAQAPFVAPTVAPGATQFEVDYDLTGYPIGSQHNPLLIVSHPGRTNPSTGEIFFPAYSVPITAGTKGSVEVPVSALQGDGMYGVGIVTDSTSTPYPVSDFAYTRISTAGTARPAAPQFVVPSTMPTGYAVSPHFADMPYKGSVQLSYDVSNVPNATGAKLEISAGGPNVLQSLFMFNNPNGSIVDANGADTGSVYEQTLGGVKNTVTINALADGLIPSMAHEVRVIPMDGSVPVGEASDASFIAMDGVDAPNGGDLEFGFGINQSGNDGMLVTALPDGLGIYSSVNSFDQTTMQPGPAIVAKASGGDYYTVPGAGMLPDDTAFFMDAPAVQANSTSMFYRTIPGLATAAYGSLGTPFTPPLSSPTTEIMSSGVNSADSMTAFFEMDPFDFSNATPAVFTYNPSTRAFGPLISLTSAFAAFGDNPVAFDYDATTNKGYLVLNSFSGGIKTKIIEIDFATQTVTSFTSPVGCAATNDFAIDENTNIGVIVAGGALCPPSNTLQIVNLATNTVTGVLLPQIKLNDIYQKEPSRVAVDPINHVFLLEFLYSPDFETNNNSLSTVVVVDENGNELSVIQKFNLYGFSGASHAFSVDPKHRMLFTLGPATQGLGPTELEPYPY